MITIMTIIIMIIFICFFFVCLERREVIVLGQRDGGSRLDFLADVFWARRDFCSFFSSQGCDISRET